MEIRFQYVILMKQRLQQAVLCCLALCSTPVLAETLDIDTEFFEVGVSAGVLDVEDFGSELTMGVYATFRATEDFFLQSNYVQTRVSYSSVESGPQGPFSGNRNYRHYNLLLGYNLFQGEVFRGEYSGLAGLYLVGGVGDTKFMDEANFTYIYGIGYQLSVSRKWTIRVDYHNYQYDSIVIDQLQTKVDNTHLLIGGSYMF